MALYLDAKVGDILTVGDTQIEILHKSGRSARLKIIGPDVVDLARAPRPPVPQRELALEAVDGRSQ